MTISDSTVAIIGTGNIGSELAANLAAGGQDFLLAGRDQDAARKIASGLGVPAGQEEVLTAGREVRREPAADVTGADDGNRAIRDGHLGSPFTWVVV